MSFLTCFIESSKSSGSRQKDKYTLDQILTIFVLKKKQLTSKSIADAVGHSHHSVTYKIGWINSKFEKFGETAMIEIYKAFNTTIPENLEKDVMDRVEKFLDPNYGSEQQESTEEQAS